MKPSAAFLVASNIVSAGLKFGIFVLLVSEGNLSVAGSYTLGLAITTPTFLFFNLGLRDIYVTSHDRDLFFQRVLLLRAAYGCLAVVVATVICAVFFRENLVLVLWMAVYRYTEVLLDIIVAYHQRRSSAIGMATLNISFSLLTLTSMGIAFLVSHDLVFAVMIASVVGLLVFVVAMLVSRPWTREKSAVPTLVQLRTVFKNGSMLSLSSFAVSFGTNTPVLFIESFHSSEQVGLYSAIYHINTVSNILYSSIAQLELRRFSVAVRDHQYVELKNRWCYVTIILTAVGFLGCIFIAFFGLDIFGFVFSQDFSDVYSALLVMGLVICLTPAGFLLDAQLVSLSKYSSQGIVAVTSLLLTFFLAFILIPPLSVFGGVTVVLITLVYRNVVKYMIVQKEIRRRICASSDVNGAI